MTYETLFVGAGAIVLGTLLGTWIGARLNYSFQKRLLEQQLHFLKEQAILNSAERKEISEEVQSILQEIRKVLNYRLGKIGSPSTVSVDELART